MPSYVQANTTDGDELFAGCGSTEIAGRGANTDSEVAGSDYCYVLNSSLSITQPHDHLSHSSNTAHALHQVTITVPNYEPIQAALINVLNGQMGIEQLTLNTCIRKPGGANLFQMTGQYKATNGKVVDYSTDMTGSGDGRLVITFVFEKIQHDNKVSHTSGVLHTAA